MVITKHFVFIHMSLYDSVYQLLLQLQHAATYCHFQFGARRWERY